MRISGTEPSSVVLSQRSNFKSWKEMSQTCQNNISFSVISYYLPHLAWFVESKCALYYPKIYLNGVSNINDFFKSWVYYQIREGFHRTFATGAAGHQREKGRDLTQSYDKSPLHQKKCQKGKVTTQTTPQKSSIKQRLRTDLGRSVGVTKATQLVWLTGLRAHLPTNRNSRLIKRTHV